MKKRSILFGAIIGIGGYFIGTYLHDRYLRGEYGNSYELDLIKVRPEVR